MTSTRQLQKLLRTRPLYPQSLSIRYQSNSTTTSNIQFKIPSTTSETPSPEPIPPKGWIPPRRQTMNADFPKIRLAFGVLFTVYMTYAIFTTDSSKPPQSISDTDADTDTVEEQSLPPSSPSTYTAASSSSPSSSALQAQAPSLADRDALTKRESGVTTDSPMRLRMEQWVKENQAAIVAALEKVDGGKFQIDEWTRPNGGGGISCVLQNGNVFEKAGVNVSVVYGTLPRAAIQRMKADHKNLDPNVDSLEFFASGLSLVLHPHNPNAPTIHLNYRYFETAGNDGTPNNWWFGGGSDLTPCYLYDEDAIAFHAGLKAACDKHDRSYYPRFKKWCDEYFKNTHRGEARGVGGIFFDDLDEDEKDREELFSFAKDCLASFLPTYLPIIQKRKDQSFTPQQKEWQQIRRGRYVEFNLVHDRGTSFGLNTPNARVESILMSLPLTARWEYMHQVPGAREEKLINVLKNPVEWV